MTQRRDSADAPRIVGKSRRTRNVAPGCSAEAIFWVFFFRSCVHKLPRAATWQAGAWLRMASCGDGRRRGRGDGRATYADATMTRAYTGRATKLGISGLVLHGVQCEYYHEIYDTDEVIGVHLHF